MKIVIEASDKRQGMTLDELEQAVHQARNAGTHRLAKAVVGFKGQVQSLAFEEEKSEGQD